MHPCTTCKSTNWSKNLHPLPHWITVQWQPVHGGNFIEPWNWCVNVLDLSQESCSGVEVSRGHNRPLLTDRQGTVKQRHGEHVVHVFTSPLLQVMSPGCKKIDSSWWPRPFVSILEDKHRISAWKEIQAQNWLEFMWETQSFGALWVQAFEVGCRDVQVLQAGTPTLSLNLSCRCSILKESNYHGENIRMLGKKCFRCKSDIEYFCQHENMQSIKWIK